MYGTLTDSYIMPANNVVIWSKNHIIGAGGGNRGKSTNHNEITSQHPS